MAGWEDQAPAVIHLDTSVLVDALTGAGRSAAALRRTIEAGERVGLSSLALYEWLRGPRRPAEVAAQEAILPAGTAIQFGPREASIAANLYRATRGARLRAADLAIAACAISHAARLWTLDPDDFRDIPDLVLFTPAE
jgi:predicted nucleic acid-binding protein